MKKRIVALLLVALMLTMTGCGKRRGTVEEAETAPETVVESVKTETPESSEKTETIPGLAESIFDDLPDETTEENKPTEQGNTTGTAANTNPGMSQNNTESTTPNTNSGTDSNSGSVVRPSTSGNSKPKPSSKPDYTDKKEPSDDSGSTDDNKPSEKPSEKPGSSQDNEKEEEKLDGKVLTYTEFHDMTPGKQQTYMESFNDIDAFFAWYNSAKESYEKENPPIEVDGGSIDMGEIMKENK